jgi:hypothetical protein
MIAGTFCDPTDHSSAFFSKQKERKKKKERSVKFGALLIEIRVTCLYKKSLIRSERLTHIQYQSVFNNHHPLPH